MSQTLALKYRPRRFEDLIGQESVSRTLAMALDSGRLGHAYLFSGLRGSGKTSTARIFSRALLCEQGPTAHPCDTCDQCRMANEGSHIDIVEMDAASNRGIDDIRELIEHTLYKPSIGRYKIFIIDEVHMLTNEAHNALLKTLEEPPEYVKFILATTDPLKLPATILSRTQHFRFKRIARPAVVRHLEHILHQEAIDYEPEALEILARSGGGSLRDTLTLLDQAIVYAKGRVDVVTVTQMLGIVDPAFLERLFTTALAKDEAAMRDLLQELEHYEAEMIVDEMSLFLKETLYRKDPRFTPMLLERFFRILADAKPLLQMGSDGSFVLALTLFKLMEATQLKQIDEMIEALEEELGGCVGIRETGNERRETGFGKRETRDERGDLGREDRGGTVSPKERPAPVVSAMPADPRLQFKKLIEKIYDRDPELGRAFEEHITFVSFENGQLTWRSRAEGEAKTVLKHGFGVIRQMVREIFGVATKIALAKTAPASEAPETPEKENLSHNASEKTVSQTPVPKPPLPDANAATQTSSMIEEVEGGSCIAACGEASKELDAEQIRNDPMIQKACELFEPRKIVVRNKV